MLEKKNARLDLRMHARAKHDLREGGKELLVRFGSGNNAHAKWDEDVFLRGYILKNFSY